MVHWSRVELDCSEIQLNNPTSTKEMKTKNMLPLVLDRSRILRRIVEKQIPIIDRGMLMSARLRCIFFFIMLFGFAYAALAQQHEIWTLWQQQTIARLDTTTNMWTKFGTGMIDPARPNDPPGVDWTTISETPDGTLYLLRRQTWHSNGPGEIMVYSVPANNIVVNSNGYVANLQLVGSTGLCNNADGLTAGPDGNLYFSAANVGTWVPGAPGQCSDNLLAGANGLYRYELSTHTTAFVGTFTANPHQHWTDAFGPSFYTDLAFDPLPLPNGADLVGLGVPSTGGFALFTIPRATVLNGTNQTFPWTPLSSGVTQGLQQADGIAYDPLTGNLFLSGDGTPNPGGVSTALRTGLSPTVITGTAPDLGWDLANQVAGCAATRPIRTLCVPGKPGDFTFTFEITNHSGKPMTSLSIADPLPNTVTPHSIPLNPLQNNSTAQVTVTIHGAAPGQVVCLKGVLFEDCCPSCCKFQVCMTIPDCTCLQVVRDFPPRCSGHSTGSFTYTFQIQNLSPQMISDMFIHPPTGVTVTPDFFTFSPAIPPNGIDPLFRTITITGATPGSRLCFDVSIHDADLNGCCVKQICIDVPRCDWDWWDDTNIATRQAAGAGQADVSQLPAGAVIDTVKAELAADDFVVSQPSEIETVSIPVYAVGSKLDPPVDFLSIEVWSGRPNADGSRRIYGNADQNVLHDAVFSGTYLVANDAPLTSTDRPVWLATEVLDRALILQPGTYWLVLSARSRSGTTLSVPYKVTAKGVVQGNALVRVDGTWKATDLALPFSLRGRVLPPPSKNVEPKPGQEVNPP
jgi:hypothetical protein